MAYMLGSKSLAELRGVHPKIISVVHEAISITKQDFSVHDGLRTLEEQREYVRRRVSKTMNSLHLPQGDGFGHAVDLVPWINGQMRWEWPPIYVIASAVHAAASKLCVPLIWGGVWDRNFDDLPGTPEGLETAVNSYVARRRGQGKSAFIDGPHFQMR